MCAGITTGDIASSGPKIPFAQHFVDRNCSSSRLDFCAPSNLSTENCSSSRLDFLRVQQLVDRNCSSSRLGFCAPSNLSTENCSSSRLDFLRMVQQCVGTCLCQVKPAGMRDQLYDTSGLGRPCVRSGPRACVTCRTFRDWDTLLYVP
jgi:hypothetical protein